MCTTLACQILYGKGSFILGDSSYALESFIIPPFDLPNSKIPEDAFSFYHSNAHITVECAFGDIDIQWEIFWKRLKCSMEHAILITEGTLHLHNVLVNYREEMYDSVYLHLDTAIFQSNL